MPPTPELPPAVTQTPEQGIPKELPKSGMEQKAQSSNKAEGVLVALGIATLAGAAGVISRRLRQSK